MFAQIIRLIIKPHASEVTQWRSQNIINYGQWLKWQVLIGWTTHTHATWTAVIDTAKRIPQFAF